MIEEEIKKTLEHLMNARNDIEETIRLFEELLEVKGGHDEDHAH